MRNTVFMIQACQGSTEYIENIYCYFVLYIHFFLCFTQNIGSGFRISILTYFTSIILKNLLLIVVITVSSQYSHIFVLLYFFRFTYIYWGLPHQQVGRHCGRRKNGERGIRKIIQNKSTYVKILYTYIHLKRGSQKK